MLVYFPLSGNLAEKSRVPIYSLSSWMSIVSLKAAMFVDPVRDIYEVRYYSRDTGPC